MLADELALLRKYGGFSNVRLARAPLLTHVLGGADEPYERLRDRFISAVQSLRDPEPSLLLAVFGLTPETAHLALLRQRREHYGRQIGRSVETVADLEPAALEHLRLQLVTGWYPLSPLGLQVPLAHNGVVFESVDIRVVVKNRQWHETRENHRFFAAFDEADYVTISSSYPGRVDVFGSDFTVRTVRVGESYSHQFWHHQPMRRGRHYKLHFRMTPHSDDAPLVLTETSRAFHEPTRFAQIDIVFLGAKPQLVWTYERLGYFERPGPPTTARALTGTRDRVSLTVTDLHGGLFSGAAWQW